MNHGEYDKGAADEIKIGDKVCIVSNNPLTVQHEIVTVGVPPLYLLEYDDMHPGKYFLMDSNYIMRGGYNIPMKRLN